MGTWNMYGRLPPENLEPFIQRPTPLADGDKVDFHLLVIGTQECEKSIERSVIFPSKEVWEKQISSYLEARYTFVQSETMAAIHLAVFILSELKPFLKGVQFGHVATGIGSVIGNKGGVGIGILLNQTSLLFVNSHFTAHQRKVAERNNDFHRIHNELDLKGFDTDRKGTLIYNNNNEISRYRCVDASSVSDRFDYTFWAGDLNYRINGTRKMVDNLLLSNMFEVLLANDQLNSERSKGNVFAGFEEASITFPPTYKFDVPKLSTREGSEDVINEDNDDEDMSRSPTSPNSSEVLGLQSPQSSPGSEEFPTQPNSTIDMTLAAKAPKPLTRGHSVYDTSKKQRIQSWTDRILYKQPRHHAESSKKRLTSTGDTDLDAPSVKVLTYGSCMEMTWSDHKPVYAHFEIPFDWNEPEDEQSSMAPKHDGNLGLCKIM